jgi:hypothetical protein
VRRDVRTRLRIVLDKLFLLNYRLRSQPMAVVVMVVVMMVVVVMMMVMVVVLAMMMVVMMMVVVMPVDCTITYG